MSCENHYRAHIKGCNTDHSVVGYTLWYIPPCMIAYTNILTVHVLYILYSETTPEGRKITKLDQILLNGNNITMLVPGGEYPLDYRYLYYYYYYLRHSCCSNIYTCLPVVIHVVYSDTFLNSSILEVQRSDCPRCNHTFCRLYHKYTVWSNSDHFS